MTTGPEKLKRCPFCGDFREPQIATIPFAINNRVVVVKEVPAEVCQRCGEAILTTEVSNLVSSFVREALEKSPAELMVLTLQPAVAV